MEEKLKAQLAQAKADYYAGRLLDCYAVLKRFFDRLPFQPREEHGEYIAMFCGVLIDLKKKFDLNFYIRELERLHEQNPTPSITHALAVAYHFGPEPRADLVRKMLESVVCAGASRIITERSKIMLALHYLDRDFMACCHIVHQFATSGDPYISRLQNVWRAVVLRRRGNLGEARAALEMVYLNDPQATDWYSYFSAKIIEGLIDVDEDKLESAQRIQQQLAEQVGKFGARTRFERQLDALSNHIEKANTIGVVKIEECDDKLAFIYENKRVYLSQKAPAEKLLVLLAKSGIVDKVQIVKSLYGRAYTVADDSLIYYHVHALRKRLRQIGLPPESIQTEKDGYRWLPTVEWKDGES